MPSIKVINKLASYPFIFKSKVSSEMAYKYETENNLTEKNQYRISGMAFSLR